MTESPESLNDSQLKTNSNELRITPELVLSSLSLDADAMGRGPGILVDDCDGRLQVVVASDDSSTPESKVPSGNRAYLYEPLIRSGVRSELE